MSAARIERLRAAAADAGLDAVLVTSPASIFWLTGFDSMQFERLFAVALPAAGGGGLVVPRLDEAGAAAVSPLDVAGYDAASDGFPELAGLLGGARAIGVEEDHLTFARAERLRAEGMEPSAAGALVMALRARKDPEELVAIRHACAVIAEEMERMFSELRTGDVEQVVNARIAQRLGERGAAESHPLILFGSNGANPHGTPGDRPLQEGDVIVADVSARFGGYWGDITRCATAGAPSEWAQRAWDVVRDAQAAAIALCRAGVPARDVDTAQREIVEAAAPIGRCLHGAGHAIGTEIHEPPFLVPRTADPLEPGHVLTVEPGLYAAGIGGIRLEDDVVVTDGDPELLSDLPLELREVG
jgi:Xaa-Pro dipeptidase